MSNIVDYGDLRVLGKRVREARRKLGWTQAVLASCAGIARPTVSLLENGLATELGFSKVASLLKVLGLGIQIVPLEQTPAADMLRVAATAASVSFKEPLEEDELFHALMTGKAPTGKRPHVRALLQAADAALIEALMRELRQRTPPGRIERGISRLVESLNIKRDLTPWLKTD
ncbi:MAG: helix-turn-helix transcriptional regulator [Betaproteobacteria bacterium]|nr:helix-turn-helix transcriptional regulator [Betaproteobacteria bacterium]